MPTDDRHPDEIAQELTGNLPPWVRGPLLSSYIGTQVCDEECPPGCEPANKCHRDAHNDHRACIECWLLYMARAAGVALPEGTVRA